jgi:hypothetical protein
MEAIMIVLDLFGESEDILVTVHVDKPIDEKVEAYASRRDAFEDLLELQLVEVKI